MNSDQIFSTFEFVGKFKVNIPSRQGWMDGWVFTIGQSIVIYTNGSRMNAVCGAKDLLTSVSVSLGVYFTIFFANILAIMVSVEMKLQLVGGYLSQLVLAIAPSRAGLLQL